MWPWNCGEPPSTAWLKWFLSVSDQSQGVRKTETAWGRFFLFIWLKQFITSKWGWSNENEIQFRQLQSAGSGLQKTKARHFTQGTKSWGNRAVGICWFEQTATTRNWEVDLLIKTPSLLWTAEHNRSSTWAEPSQELPQNQFCTKLTSRKTPKPAPSHHFSSKCSEGMQHDPERHLGHSVYPEDSLKQGQRGWGSSVPWLFGNTRIIHFQWGIWRRAPHISPAVWSHCFQTYFYISLQPGIPALIPEPPSPLSYI